LTISYSLLIPTYNGLKHLSLLRPSLLDLEKKGCELVFIDSCSTDGTFEFLKKSFPTSVYSIAQSDFDHGGTRNLLINLSHGDVCIFITQDVFIKDINNFENLIKVFSDTNIAAAYGKQVPYQKTSLFGKHLRRFNYDDKSYARCIDDKYKYGIKTAFLSNSFAAYRRSALDEINLFKDGLILGEDVYVGAKFLKRGLRVAYVADAQVYHSHSYTVFEEFKRYFDIGVFHNMEIWILNEFGRPEGEGMRYVKSELSYLFKHNAYYLFPEFIVRNVMKYLGYKLGRNFEYLPKNVVKRFSMHHRWWNKYFKEAL